MAWLLIGWGLLLIALALPAGPGIPLTTRYRRLSGRETPLPVRRRVMAWLRVDRLLPLLPRRYRENLQAQLVMARMAGPWPLADFVALKLALTTAAGVVMLLYWRRMGSPLFLLGIPLECAAGWTLPDFWVKRRAAARMAQVEREVPHLLSSLAIALQTGLSLPSALVQLASLPLGGVLGEELVNVSAHLSAGATPYEALTALIERCRTPSLAKALGNVLQHADKSPRAAAGAAAAESRLAWQSRRRRAEAIAQTATLKLFLPQLLLGLPSLFLVLLGPAALKLWESFRNVSP